MSAGPASVGRMQTVFLGSEAVATGQLTRGQLRSRYRALFPDVYQSKLGEPSLHANAVGAWLWSKRRGVITGRAAAAFHGALWVDPRSPVELLWKNCRPPAGIVCRDECFTYDDVVELDGLPVATIQRTAFDLGRHLKRGSAVSHLDALARATGLRAEHVLPLADAHKGSRGVRRLREAVELMDGGAQSPKETWLRLLLVDAGLPRPSTQIPVLEPGGRPVAYLDLGWEAELIAVEYDGDQHRTDRLQYAWDVRRARMLADLGWLHIRVIAEDTPGVILERVRRAWAQRETEARAVRRPA